MSYLYNQVKDEILRDHKRNDYMRAYEMPLRDRYSPSREQQEQLKQIARQLTDDVTFPYEVSYTFYNDHMYTDTVKMTYKPL